MKLKRRAITGLLCNGFKWRPSLSSTSMFVYESLLAEKKIPTGFRQSGFRRSGGHAFAPSAFVLTAADRSGLRRTSRMPPKNGGTSHKTFSPAKQLRDVAKSAPLAFEFLLIPTKMKPPGTRPSGFIFCSGGPATNRRDFVPPTNADGTQQDNEFWPGTSFFVAGVGLEPTTFGL